MESKIYYLRTITPTHFGTGRAAGAIDLPIAREISTGLPIAPGSGIKGVLRDHFQGDPDQTRMFGPDRGHADDHGGILSPQDAYLLCLPVRSLKGTCAWVASPLTLLRYAREAKACGVATPDLFAIAENSVAASSTVSFVSSGMQKVALHELVRNHDASLDSKRALWAKHVAQRFFAIDDPWAPLFEERFVVAHDESLNFLAEAATDVRARVALDEKRVVIDGANWNEESLPAETLLWGVIGTQEVRHPISLAPGDALAKLHLKLKPETLLQMGGKATVGRGVVKFLI